MIRALVTPECGQVYSDRDPLSRYRVRVVQVNHTVLNVGGRGVQVQNLVTGRRHWTSVRQLYRYYRLVP